MTHHIEYNNLTQQHIQDSGRNVILVSNPQAQPEAESIQNGFHRFQNVEEVHSKSGNVDEWSKPRILGELDHLLQTTQQIPSPPGGNSILNQRWVVAPAHSSLLFHIVDQSEYEIILLEWHLIQPFGSSDVISIVDDHPHIVKLLKDHRYFLNATFIHANEEPVTGRGGWTFGANLSDFLILTGAVGEQLRTEYVDSCSSFRVKYVAI